MHPCSTGPAGHGKQHKCGINTHTCGKLCSLKELSLFDCDGVCTGDVTHGGSCQCDGMHLCGKPCVAPGCPNRCRSPNYNETHIHDCGVCPSNCGMERCGKPCRLPHSHIISDSEQGREHFCDDSHECYAYCNRGLCKVTDCSTTVVEMKGRFQQYKYTVGEQVKKILKCRLPIPPRKLSSLYKDSCNNLKPP